MFTAQSHVSKPNPMTLCPQTLQVSVEEGEDRSSKEGCMFIESSAKAGFNIKALFRKLATALPGMEASAPAQQPAQNRKLNE